MSSVNIAELLDQMDEVIENATASMLSSKRYIDIPAMQELIAQARENLPTEIEQATQIVRDRSAILKVQSRRRMKRRRLPSAMRIICAKTLAARRKRSRARPVWKRIR